MVIFCWIVIHTSLDKLDNRRYEKVKGYIMKEHTDTNLVNFYDSFVAMKIDMKYNPPTQSISENECLYVEN